MIRFGGKDKSVGGRKAPVGPGEPRSVGQAGHGVFRAAMRRVLLMFLSLVTVVSVMIPGAGIALADDGDTFTADSGNGALDATSLFIKMFQGKKLTSNDVQSFFGGDLTSEAAQRKWQFLGVLLSNYYAPFSTDLKSSDLLDESTSGGNAYKNMVELLTSGDGGFGMDEDLAKMVAQGVLGSVQNDSEELRFAYCKSANHHVTPDMLKTSASKPKQLKEGQCILDSKAQEPVTLYTLYLAAVGDFPSAVLAPATSSNSDNFVVNSRESYDGVMDSLAGKAFGTWLEGKRNANTVVVYGAKSKFPAFVADAYGEEITPSVLTLIQILKHCNTGMGYGDFLIDDPTAGKNTDVNSSTFLNDLFKTTVDPNRYLTYAIPLKLSPFGDLWMDGGASDLIVMPGATNPMIYMPVGEKGKDAKSQMGLGLGTLSTLWIQGINDGLITDTGEEKKVCSNHNDNVVCDMVSNQLGGDGPLWNIKGGGEWDGSMDYKTDDLTKLGYGWGSGHRHVILARGYKENKLAQDGFWSFGGNPDEARKAFIDPATQYLADHPKTINNTVRALSKGDWGNNTSEEYIGIPWFNYPSDEGKEGKTGYRHQIQMQHGGVATMMTNQVGSSDKQRPIYDNILMIDDLGLLSSVSGDSSSDAEDDEEESSDDGDSDDEESDESTVEDGKVDYTGIAVCNMRGLVGKGGSECQPADGSTGGDATEIGEAIKSTGTGLDGTNQPANGETLAINIANPKMQAMLVVNYLIASVEPNADIRNTWSKTGYRFYLEGLPAPKHFSLEISAEAQEDQMAKDIKNWIWFLLNPTVGFRYKMTWLSGMLSSAFIGWHNDMVGASGVGNLPGTTKYTGFNGYVTTPTLSDMEWSSGLVSWYQEHLVLIIVLVAMLLLCFVVTNTMGVQKAMVSLGVFIVLALVPAVAVNSLANISNGISNRVYSSKFVYWALAQHETYAEAIDKALQDNDITSYMRAMYGISSSDGTYANAGGNRGAGIETTQGNTSFDYNSQGDNNILLKWQAPKKMSGIDLNTESDGSWLGVTSDWMSMLGSVMRGGFDGQSFDTGSDDYLYRDYTDLGDYSQYVYLALTSGSPNAKKAVPYVETVNTDWWDAGVKNAYSQMSNTLNSDRENDLTNFGIETPTHWVFPFGSSIYQDSVNRGNVADLQQGETMGLSPECMNYGLRLFNQYGNDGNTFATYDGLSNCVADGGEGSGKSEADFGSLAAYELISESPFFWQSWNLYDQGISASVGSSGSFKDTILPEGGLSYFYDTSNGNDAEGVVHTGEMKDYLDLKGLFTYYMPYARMGNRVVREYMDTYGYNYYEGISSEDGHAEDYASDPAALQKYWHNVNLAHLYNIYCPWVDIMDTGSYAQPVTVSYNGKRATIDNPLDPGAYPEDRPMVFSAAEQAQYGLLDSQLTDAERKIQQVEEDTQEDYINLLNYYTFKDNVLDTAAAMLFTFNFNRVFSDSKPISLGSSVATLYPQSFELKNFTYDAYLRLIINSSTGQSLNGYSYAGSDNTGAGFYAQTVQNSSFLTALGFIVLDVLAIYVVPVLKAFFVVGIYIMLIILLLATVFKLQDNPWSKFFSTTMKPLIIFFAVTTGMAIVVSLFMSSGNTAVTGDTGVVIRLGDPTLVVFTMIAINIVVAMAYVVLARNLALNIWRNGKDVVFSVGSVIGGVGKAIAAGFSSAMSGKGFKAGYSNSIKTGKVSNGGAGASGGAGAGAGAATATAGGMGVVRGATGRTAVLLRSRAGSETRKAARRGLNRLRRPKNTAMDAGGQHSSGTQPDRGHWGFGGQNGRGAQTDAGQGPDRDVETHGAETRGAQPSDRSNDTGTLV